MAELLYRLGRLSARRGWLVVLAWTVVLGIAGAGFVLGHGALTASFDIPGTASGRTADQLSAKLKDFGGASGTIVARTTDGTAFNAAQKAAIADVVSRAGDLPDVSRAIDPFAVEAQRATQRTQIEQGRARLDAARAELDVGENRVAAAETQLAAARAQVPAGAPASATAALDAQQARLDAQKTQLADGRAKLDARSAELERGATLLDLAKRIRTVSADGSAALISVAFSKPRLELPDSAKAGVIDHFMGVAGVRFDASNEIASEVPQVLGPGEAAGVLLAALVLAVMLGTALAAVLPLIGSLIGVGVGVLGTLAFSGVMQMASITPTLGVMLGLAVGIDYALFIINRHRRQLRAGAELHESIALANGTAGSAVVFAGSTVIVALLALNVTAIPFLGLMGTVAAVCVAIAVIVAITLTPALLRLVGMRVLSRRQRAAIVAPEHPRTGAKEPRPMSTVRAMVTVVAAIAVLLTVAIPSLSMRLGLPDGSSEAVDSTAYRAYQVTGEQFGEGANGPLLVTAALPSGLSDGQVAATQLRVAERIADRRGVVAVAPIAVSDDNRLAAYQVLPNGGPNSESTAWLVGQLRSMAAPQSGARLGVAGQSAINIDVSDKLAGALPVFLAVVVGLSLIIIMIVFRSLLVPLLATGGFILSLLATYGGVTAVYQWGWLAPVFQVHDPGPILNFLPVILSGILFGLAMDYQLFLATGMREAYVHGASAREAVARGVHAGRAVVIAAGLIMVSVFSGFIFAEAVIIRSIGFGLAFGVLVDAFVVRLLVMPALMHLLGPAAWWFPRWLDRIVPDVDVEGAKLERTHPAL
ncbi:MAG: MMPL family transporter [Micrococcales bacterium]|nr:MMPL family transporter [Micrococcales bacterium]